MNFLMQASPATASAPLPAVQVLSQLAAVAFGNAEMGQRHPAALYDLAIRTVAEAFDDALNAYDAVVQRGEGDRLKPELKKALIRAMDFLLDAVAEHFDDAKSCLQIVLEDLPRNEASRHLRQYADDIREVRAFCATQVNEMKHRQGRLQLVHMTFANSVLWGYFVQGVGRHGEIGPSRLVHKSNTAYSFGRAFRMLAMAVFYTSKALAAAMLRNPSHRLERGVHGFGTLLPLAQRLAELPRIVFWDEIGGCPDFMVLNGKAEVRLPAQRRWKRPPQNTRINLTVAMEAQASSYGLPYMGDYMARQ